MKARLVFALVAFCSIACGQQSSLVITAACPAPVGIGGRAYSFAVTASGGTLPYHWALSAGSSLPANLVLNPNTGAISGIPDSPSLDFYPISVDVTDSSDNATTATYICNIAIIPQLTITSTCGQANGMLNVPYSFTLSVVGGFATDNFAIVSGALPPGLILDPSSGVISGVPITPGTFPVGIQVTDSAPETFRQASIFSCNLTISTAPLRIVAACPASPAVQNTLIRQTLVASGGAGQYDWQVSVGSLPDLLTLKGDLLFGTLAANYGTYTFTLQVTSGEQSAHVACGIIVTPPAVQVTSGCPGDGIQGVPYGPFTLSAIGGLGPTSYAFSITGSLPDGLALVGNVIAGTPRGPPGTSIFGIRATSGNQSGTAGPCSVTIVSPSLVVTGTCPASAQAGVPFTTKVSVSGGSPPYSYSFIGPTWMTFSEGVISGTPSDAGTASFSLAVIDSTNSPPQVYRCSFPVAGVPLQISGVCPAQPVQGVPVVVLLSATGGKAPYTWSYSGPSWLPLSSTTGPAVVLSGTPPSYDIFIFSVALKDATGAAAPALNCLLKITPPALHIAASAACPVAPLALHATYLISFAGSGGVPPYAWSFNGPSWLSLNSASGNSTALYGTAPEGGSFGYTVTLTDSANATQTFSCQAALSFAAIPQISITGLVANSDLMASVPAGLSLESPAAVDLTGKIRLTFTPDATNPADNPQVTFADPCQRECSFAIPSGVTTINLLNVQQGTVAGTICIEITDLHDGIRDVLPAIHPSACLTVTRTAPVITSVTFANETSNGFDIVVSGYSTPRDITSAKVSFQSRSDATLGGVGEFVVDLRTLFDRFYQSPASLAGGSTFAGLRLPVVVTGDKTSIGAVIVTLTNSAGQSNPVSTTR